MLSRSITLFGFLMLCAGAPSQAQDSASVRRTVLPVLDGIPIQECHWVANRNLKGSREAVGVADATWVFPTPMALVEDTLRRTPTSRRWESRNAKAWLSIERGPVGGASDLAFGFGPWPSLVTSFYYVGAEDEIFSISVSHGTPITSRCHEIIQGRRMYAAWGGATSVSEMTRTHYQSFAAFELGPNDWLVIWGGGRTPQKSADVQGVIRSIRF